VGKFEIMRVDHVLVWLSHNLKDFLDYGLDFGK
jgi:hypothetical protein